MFGGAPTFHVMIWFVIQLTANKQFHLKVDAVKGYHEVSNVQQQPLRHSMKHENLDWFIKNPYNSYL